MNFALGQEKPVAIEDENLDDQSYSNYYWSSHHLAVHATKHRKKR